MWHSASPVIDLREQFDPSYATRTALWGNAYPRPSVEPIEKAWQLPTKHLQSPNSDIFGIRVLFDPDLDFSTYLEALSRFEVVSTWDFDSQEILASKKKRDQIANAFADIMDLNYLGELEQQYEKKL